MFWISPIECIIFVYVTLGVALVTSSTVTKKSESNKFKSSRSESTSRLLSVTCCTLFLFPYCVVWKYDKSFCGTWSAVRMWFYLILGGFLWLLPLLAEMELIRRERLVEADKLILLDSDDTVNLSTSSTTTKSDSVTNIFALIMSNRLDSWGGPERPQLSALALLYYSIGYMFYAIMVRIDAFFLWKRNTNYSLVGPPGKGKFLN